MSIRRIVSTLVLVSASLAMSTPGHAAGKSWTILLYWNADCDIEGNILRDLRQVASQMEHEKVRVLAMVDRWDGDGASNGAADDADAVGGVTDWTAGKYLLIDHESANSVAGNPGVHDVTPASMTTEPNMGSTAGVLRPFLDFAVANYAADQYALVLKGHGAGWKHLLPDMNPSDGALQVGALAATLRDWTKEKLLRPLDLLVFDACYMGHLEVAADMADFADWIVLSSDYLDTQSICYKKILVSELTEDVTPVDLGKAFVQNYLAWDTAGNGAANVPTTTRAHGIYASFKNSDIAAVTHAFEALAPLLETEVGSGGLDRIREVRRRTWGYSCATRDGSIDRSTCEHYDIADLCLQLLVPYAEGTPIGKAAKQVLAALGPPGTTTVTLSRSADTLDGGGLTVNFPTGSNGVEELVYAPLAERVCPNWLSFLRAFVSADSDPGLKPTPPCPPGEPVESPATITGDGHPAVVRSQLAAEDVGGTTEAVFVVAQAHGEPVLLGGLPVAMLEAGPENPGGRTLRFAWDGRWPRIIGEDGWIPCPVRLARPLGGGRVGYVIDAPMILWRGGSKQPIRLRIALERTDGDWIGSVLYATVAGPAGDRRADLKLGDSLSGAYQTLPDSQGRQAEAPESSSRKILVRKGGTVNVDFGPLEDGIWRVGFVTHDRFRRAHASHLIPVTVARPADFDPRLR